MALEGNLDRLYDLTYQRDTQQRILGEGHEGLLDLYLSPPFVAYLYAPLAALPYLAAAALWTALTILLLWLSLHLLWPLLPNLHRHGFGLAVVLAFSTQPVFELLGDGQDSAISLLLLAGGLRLLLGRHDVLAGGVLGLGVFKPQLFLVIPVLLLVQRRGRALASWVTVALALALISLAMVGARGVHAYLSLLTSEAYRLGIVDGLGWKMQSAIGFVRALLPETARSLASPVAAAMGMAAFALLLRAASRPAQDSRSFALLYALATLLVALVNPHLFLYDCVVFLLPALILLDQAPASPAVRLSLAAAYVLFWTVPLRYIAFGHAPWPVSILAGQWTILPLVALVAVAARLLSVTLLLPRREEGGGRGLGLHGQSMASRRPRRQGCLSPSNRPVEPR